MTAEQDRIRKEIDKAYKAVTNKINRTKKQTGANVGGSKFDPRRAPGTENRMRSPQRMQAYLDELKLFMGRSNQFVSGAGGAPLRKGRFAAYKAGETELKAVQDIRDKTFGGIKTPAGWTVREQETALPKAGGHAKYGPYGRFDRESIDITSPEALETLIKENKRQLDPEYVRGELGKGKESLDKVLDYLGESQDELRQAIDEMDEFEFDLWWFGFKGASGIFLYYELEKERADGNRKEKRQDRVIESKFKEAKPSIERAKEEGQKRRDEIAKQMGNLSEVSEQIKGFKR